MSVYATDSGNRADCAGRIARRGLLPAPRLLVSVRDAEEAERAVRGGAHVIDVKEPAAGPLGAATPAVWNAVAERLAGRRPLSIALGEMADWCGRPERLPSAASFAKAGPAGIESADRYVDRLLVRLRAAAPRVRPVAVAYADHRLAASAPPWRIAEAAGRARLGWLLVDTWRKDGRRLTDRLTAAELERIADHCARYRMRIALAGSLRSDDARRLLRLAPDLLAVRGAVCRGGRDGPVDRPRVADFLRSLTRSAARCRRAGSRIEPSHFPAGN